ncbi:hypothetical protein [Haliangium sp.]|uniref:hypothetical protein n=1 Tax=Haliangium sp. TaxID=2663208 RepID=UPI003D0C6CA9
MGRIGHQLDGGIRGVHGEPDPAVQVRKNAPVGDPQAITRRCRDRFGQRRARRRSEREREAEQRAPAGSPQRLPERSAGPRRSRRRSMWSQ